MNTHTDQIKITHCGVEVFYDEAANQFVFELRGRERRVDSLHKAREVIDAPAPKGKSVFQRVPVWVRRWSETEEGEITSIADRDLAYGGPGVFVVVNGKRSKISAKLVFPKNAHNDAGIARIRAMEEQVAMLNKTISQEGDDLKPFVVTPE